jgi:uncharacterized membrane protein YfcA
LALRRTIGGAALAFGLAQLALILAGAPQPRPRISGTTGAAVGVVAGVASTVAHSGGLVLGVYLVGRPLSGAAIVATSALVVAVADVAKVGTYWAIGWLSPTLVGAALAATPLLYLGSWLGARLNARLPRRALALSLLAIAIAGAVRLLLA